jgi:ribosomal protein L16/L10AE
MLEKIENRLNKEGRKQRGRKQLKSRVNITYPINSIAIYANKDIEMRLEQFKQIRTDLGKLVSGQYQIIFTVLPNKSFTKKGILVRMGKGKGKIDHFSSNVKAGTICIILVSKTSNNEMRDTIIENIENKILIKYPFLSWKSFNK